MIKKLHLQLLPQQAFDKKIYKEIIAGKLRVNIKDITHIDITNRSIDARKSKALVNLWIDVYINEEVESEPVKRVVYKKVTNREPVHIIGAGPAGMTAAIYAARRKIKFLILSMDIGGQMSWSSDIDNYPGLPDLAGVELVKRFNEHMKEYDIKVKQEETKNIEKKGKTIIVKTESLNEELDVKQGQLLKKDGLEAPLGSKNIIKTVKK